MFGLHEPTTWVDLSWKFSKSSKVPAWGQALRRSSGPAVSHAGSKSVERHVVCTYSWETTFLCRQPGSCSMWFYLFFPLVFMGWKELLASAKIFPPCKSTWFNLVPYRLCKGVGIFSCTEPPTKLSRVTCEHFVTHQMWTKMVFISRWMDINLPMRAICGGTTRLRIRWSVNAVHLTLFWRRW